MDFQIFECHRSVEGKRWVTGICYWFVQSEIHEIYFQISKQEVASQVLHEFMGFSETAASSEAGSSSVEGTVDTHARFVAYVATVIVCLQGGGCEKFGGRRQKLHNNTL